MEVGHVTRKPGHRATPLSDLVIRKAKPRDEGYRLPDGGGLGLFVTPAGSKLWRWRYQRDGKEQTLSLGSYPDVGLSAAREARDAAKRRLKAGEDPAAAKKADRAEADRHAAETFEAVARAHHEFAKRGWTELHASAYLASLKKHVFPTIGAIPIRRVTPQHVLDIVAVVEAKTPMMARILRQRMSAVFAFAMAKGQCQADPAAAVRAILPAVAIGQRAARTQLDEARDLLKRIDDYPCNRESKLGMRLLALTAVRSTVVLHAPWSELDRLDPDMPTWVVPAARMKLILVLKGDKRRDHHVPLSRQALEAVEALRTVTGHSPWLIPSTRNYTKPSGKTRFGRLLITITHGEHVPHGWRSTFSTIMNERFRADRQIIDMMLAHVTGDSVEAAYNRARHMDRRRELAQEWANLLTVGLLPASEIAKMPSRVSLKPLPEHDH